EEQPMRRGICAFFRRKLQAFKGAERNGGPGEPVVAEPQPEVDLTGPTKVPFHSMYDLHGKKLHNGSFVATRRSDGQETVFDTNFFIEEKTRTLKLSLSGDVKRITSVHEIRQFKGRATVLQNLETDRSYAEFKSVWYLGELAYEMIHGHEKEKGKEPKLDSSLSRECRDFISECLKRNPLHRMSLKELMAHEWINGVEEGPSDPDVSEPVPRPFHLGHTAEVELPGPTTAPLDSTCQVNEKQLFEGAFMMTRKSAGGRVIIKVLSQDAKGAMHSLCKLKRFDKI
ncbi:hypothetical protein IRJ41_014432, partial [Triplophysa rosa]